MCLGWASAQATDTPRTFSVTFRVASVVDGDNLQGIPVRLSHNTYGLNYPEAALSADGECTFAEVVEGPHTLVIDATHLGLALYRDEHLTIDSDTPIDITLQEDIVTPYALKAEEIHDPRTNRRDVVLQWNNETDYFFDDFESYEAFAVRFDPWTGIDGDKDAAAQISGSYPNAAIPQYATIFNPLVINPPVWYEYPVLRPYSGKQYVAFVRTGSGTANNDWLISPRIRVGVNNVVRFMAKAADTYKEQFRVGISTTGTEMKDFTFLTPGNYETVDYKAWKTIEYSLAAYQGQEVYITIQYISKSYFMLMVDDFYVGPSHLHPTKARKVAAGASPTNTFELFCDGVSAGTTSETSFTFTDLQPGSHTLEVQAIYRASRSDKTALPVSLADDTHYASLQVNVGTNNGRSADGLLVDFMNTETGRQDEEPIAEGKARLPYLPKGNYLIHITADGYENCSQALTLDNEQTIDLTLKEEIVTPYNITADFIPTGTDGHTDVQLKWNQDLGFTDSFETYDDFAQQFGGWTTIDGDGMPPYGISLNNVTIDFPGNNQPSPCMVFNPLATTPSMEADAAMLAPFGDKYVAFWSAQQGQSDDWLITPALTIREGYVLRFVVKSYDAYYLETVQILASESKDPDTFQELDQLTPQASAWTEYEIKLAAYAGKTIYLAFHYTSYDKFLMQLDRVYVGPDEETSGTTQTSDLVRFEVTLDGTVQGTTRENTFTLTGLNDGQTYTAGIKAIYASGESDTALYTFQCLGESALTSAAAGSAVIGSGSGCIDIRQAAGSQVRVFDTAGRMVVRADCSDQTRLSVPTGIYIVEIRSGQDIQHQKIHVY